MVNNNREKKKKTTSVKHDSFLKDGLSINETRISSLILVFIVGAGFSFYQVVVRGDIADGLLAFLGYLIMAISGINISETITQSMSRNDSTNNNYDSYDYTDEDTQYEE